MSRPSGAVAVLFVGIVLSAVRVEIVPYPDERAPPLVRGLEFALARNRTPRSAGGAFAVFGTGWLLTATAGLDEAGICLPCTNWCSTSRRPPGERDLDRCVVQVPRPSAHVRARPLLRS